MSSRAETNRWGPLDWQRASLESASAIDRELRRGARLDDERVSGFVNELSSGLLYTGQYCEIEGSIFVEDDELDKRGNPLALNLDLDLDRIVTARGIYGGIAYILAGNGRGNLGNRLVNVLISPEPNSAYQQHGHRMDFVRHTYFCVDGSQVKPVEPDNAHSLLELRGDYWTQEIEHVVLDDRLSGKDILSRLTGVLMRMLNSRSLTAQNKNHQRLSYLNSLGFFEDKILTCSEFLVGSMVHGDSLTDRDEIYIGYTKVPTEFIPGNVIALRGCKRTISDREKAKYGDLRIFSRVEPYIRGYADGEYCVTPMRLVDEIA